MNVLKSRVWLVVAVALCLFGSLLRADTLKMKNGTTVQGKYLGGTDSNVTFYVNGVLQHFPVANIQSITFGTEDSPAPAMSSSSQMAAPAAAASSMSTSQNVLVPAGTSLVVRMIDGVDSDRNKVGDTFQASLEDPLVVNGTQIAPKGSTVYGKLEQAKSAGRIEGRSELRLGLTGIVINGATYNIATGDYTAQGSSRGKQTATRAGIGAALGGLIGAVAGGGKGAAIGAGVGAGAGTAVQVMTHGEQVHVPSETVLNFTLQQPASLPVSSSPSVQ